MLAMVTSLACSVPGVFVVLRRQSMLVDAVSHAVLPGIVVGAGISGSLHSPWMIVGATVMGMVIVIGSNWLRHNRVLKGDADQGVIFPVLFALGVLLLSTTFSDTHICTDTVLAGDLNLMALPSEHLWIAGVSVGPAMMWILLAVLAATAVFIWRYIRVLEVATFDPDYARSIGIPAGRVSHALMFAVTVTIVAAFNVAGSILVIALMICPAACALLLSHRLKQVFAISAAVAVASSVLGFWLAWQANLPTSAAMALMDGLIFLVIAAVSTFAKYRRASWGDDGGGATAARVPVAVRAADAETAEV